MRSVLLALLVLGACATPAVDDWVSIDQGVYGKLQSYDDTDPSAGDSAIDNELVFIDSIDMSTTVTMTKSNDDGYYEVKLEPAGYTICLNGTSCGTFYVEAGKRTRMDFEAGPGGGMWRPVDVVPE